MADHFDRVWLRGGPYGEDGHYASIPGDGFQFVTEYVRTVVDDQEHWWKPAEPSTAQASDDNEFVALVYDYVGTEQPDELI